MPHHHWFERVDNELARRGVPARYRRRLLAELRDHADDLTNGQDLVLMTDDDLSARIGQPAALAAGADEEYRRARWTSRHPLLVFGLLPLPTILMTIIATVLLIELSGYAIAWAMGDPDHLPRTTLIAFAYTMAWAVRFAPFVVPAFLFTRLYLRSRVNMWWFVAAAAQVLVVAWSMISMIRYSDVPGESQWMVGFAWAPIPTGDAWTRPFVNLVGWMQVVQVVIPVAVGAILFRAARRMQTTHPSTAEP